MLLRMATPADAAATLAIYGQYIDTPVTFEYLLPSLGEARQRIGNTLAIYPFLVCETNGQVAGYACAHRFAQRAAYGWGAELTVYIGKEHTAAGMGTTLYQALMVLLALQGVKTVYGGVTLPNAASEKLHEKLGFHRAATYQNAGYKSGQWHNVAWFEKELGPYAADPPPVRPVSELGQPEIAAVLRRCGAQNG